MEMNEVYKKAGRLLSDDEVEMVCGGIDENYNCSGGDALPLETAEDQGKMQHKFTFDGKNFHMQ